MRTTTSYLLAVSVASALSAQTFHYAARPDALLDFYTPGTPGSHFAILAVHGGGWTAGTRADVAGFCRIMRDAGYACAAIDYRLAPEYRFPVQIDDIKAAIVYLETHSAELHLRLGQIVLSGESAGGHLVSYLGATHPAGFSIAGVISFSAPQDLIALAEPGRVLKILPPELHDLLGVDAWSPSDLDAMRVASPMDNVLPGAPPFLLIHGDADRVVPLSQTQRFCASVGNESRCQVHVVHGARHGLWQEDQIGVYAPKWRDAISQWIEKEVTISPTLK